MTETHPVRGGLLRTMAWQAGAITLLSVLAALLANLLRGDALPLPGDWSPEARLTRPSGERLAIPLPEARRLFEEKRAVFLDARPREEYDTGHILGARSLPWNEFDAQFENVMSDIVEGTTLIAYCDGDACSLSHDLAAALIDLGFTRVKVLVNGWTVWQEAGLPTEGEVRE